MSFKAETLIQILRLPFILSDKAACKADVDWSLRNFRSCHSTVNYLTSKQMLTFHVRKVGQQIKLMKTKAFNHYTVYNRNMIMKTEKRKKKLGYSLWFTPNVITHSYQVLITSKKNTPATIQSLSMKNLTCNNLCSHYFIY